MNKLVLCAVTALMVGSMSAQAGGLGEPIMAPDVVEAGTSSSAGGIIVPILLILLIAAAVSGGSNTPIPNNG